VDFPSTAGSRRVPMTLQAPSQTPRGKRVLSAPGSPRKAREEKNYPSVFEPDFTGAENRRNSGSWGRGLKTAEGQRSHQFFPRP